MPDHARFVPAVTPATPEPVAIAAAVQAVLMAGAALGWTYFDDARIAAVVTAVATVGTVASVLVARGRVRALRPDDPPAPRTVVVDAEQLRAALRAELDVRGLGGPPVWLGAAQPPRPRPYVPPA